MKPRDIILKKLEATVKHDGMLFTGYMVEGIIAEPPTVGKAIAMLRYSRNGVAAFGLFTTSPIKSIEGNKIHTQNSVWEIEYLN